jgi:hypothetical protein
MNRLPAQVYASAASILIVSEILLQKHVDVIRRSNGQEFTWTVYNEKHVESG